MFQFKDSQNNPDSFDIVIPEYGFEKSWNLGNTSTFAIDSDSVDQIGCTHTTQGLEGLKKLIENDPEEAESVSDKIINTYRTLMARGMKGCYVFCTDKKLSDYLKASLAKLNKMD